MRSLIDRQPSTRKMPGAGAGTSSRHNDELLLVGEPMARVQPSARFWPRAIGQLVAFYQWAMGTNVAPLSEFSCMHCNAIFNLGFAIFHRGQEIGSEAQINVGNAITILTVTRR